MKYQTCFLGKNKENIINLLSAELAREWNSYILDFHSPYGTKFRYWQPADISLFFFRKYDVTFDVNLTFEVNCL